MNATAIASILALGALTAPAMAAEQTVTLNVEGMYCAACPYIVKGSLASVPGVSEVNVSSERKTVTVTFDDATTNIGALIEATTDAGYPSTERR